MHSYTKLLKSRNNFGYKKGLSFLERNRYTQAAWLREVHDEMRDYGPVVYAGFSTGGGHCFVLDGYASTVTYT